MNLDLLILDYIHGELTKEKEDELKSWVESSGENAEYFTKTIAYLELTNSLENSENFSADKDWAKLASKITPRNRPLEFIKEYGKIAAVFVFAFILGYSVFQFNPKKGQANFSSNFITTEVPLGSKSVVTLPDGSRVWINAGSKLRYPIDFNEKRRVVSLIGEAFFDIVTNKNKPFFVEASGIKVKATGTQFNVRAYTDEEFIETTLVEGVVAVNRTETEYEDELILKPNQKLTVYKDNVKVNIQSTKEKEACELAPTLSSAPLKIKKVELKSDVRTDIYTSWKDKEWIIYKEKFSSLSKKLEKRYDVKLYFKDIKVRDFSYSGTLKDENLKEVLDVLSITSPIKYMLDNKNVTIWYNPEFNNN